MNPTLEELSLIPGWSPLDRQLANLLLREVCEQSWVLWLSIAMLSMATRQGDVCLALSELAGQPVSQVLRAMSRDSDHETELSGVMPQLSEWVEELKRSGLLCEPATETASALSVGPLVLKHHRLYLQRYFQHERALASHIAARLKPVQSQPPPAEMRAALERWMVGAAAQVKLAAAVAVLRRFCIIIGGPGTGKTSTVVRLMGLLSDLARATEKQELRVLLLAPTGKAAARLSESIASAKQNLTQLPATISNLSTETSTVHRAVGSCRRQRDGRRTPLLGDLIVLDEASMVDLSMMRQLMEVAVDVERVIILGDAHQLSSVEAGAVLAELCAAGNAESSPLFAPTVAETCGINPHGYTSSVGSVASGTESSTIAAHVVELTESHRFRSGGGIGLLAKSINAGDVRGTLDVLLRGDPGVSFVPGSRQALQRTEERIADANLALCDASDPKLALKQLDRFRVLCAHRKGRYGVETWNERVGRRVRAMQLARRGIRVEPILVTQNSADGRLRNGDLGILWRDSTGGHVYFRSTLTEVQAVGLSRLTAYEPAFVMSIHKSQGSEADEILVILPEADSPLLTRELLYTAVTRARTRCTIVGTREAIEVAVSRRVERKSGLAEAIVEATSTDAIALPQRQGVSSTPSLVAVPDLQSQRGEASGSERKPKASPSCDEPRGEG
ncbi:MAG: exodeoxyribonuclease V subunit alpha [Myxococcales bacterium]